MDGCSVTMYKRGEHFGVCGKNYEYADDDKCAMWNYAHKHRIEERLKENNIDNIAIQGEFCGPGIQKNRLKLTEPEWYVFTVIDMKTNTRLSMYKTEEICKMLGLNMVPIEEVEEEFQYKSVDELLERAKGKQASGKNKEGIVIRPIEAVYSNVIAGPLSMKVINNDYLLKDQQITFYMAAAVDIKAISKLQPNFVQGISGLYNRRTIILLISFTINFKFSLTLKQENRIINTLLLQMTQFKYQNNLKIIKIVVDKILNR